MIQHARSEAETLFAATQKKNEQAPDERNQAQKGRAEKVARLKFLRLANDAADKEVAVQASGESLIKKAIPAVVPSSVELNDSELLYIPQFLRR